MTVGPGTVAVRQAGGVRHLTVDRAPDNAWDLPIFHALGEALVDADADPATRVSVLAAAGPTFCAGGAIGGPTEGTSVAVHRRRYVEAFVSLDRVVRTTGTPVVARVHGAANAGGLAVVAACDVAVAARSATFATPEVKGGMFPLLAMGLLAAHLAPKRAFALFYSGEPLSADQAVEAGLVTEAVPDDELDAAVERWTQRLAAAEPRAVALGRQAYWRMATAPADARVGIGGEALLRLLGADEATPNQDYMYSSDPGATSGDRDAPDA